MMQEKENSPKEFHYFDDEGIFIGKSAGKTPQRELFDQAHYVFNAQNEVIKNQDLLVIARRKLKNLRRKLLAIPITDMREIMSVNQEITELEKNIEQLSDSGTELVPNPLGGGPTTIPKP